MKRYMLATVAALLAFPASALASTSTGVVLSVDSGHHAVQVVDSKHVVHLYSYRGRLPKLHPGSQVRFDRSGKVISKVVSTSSTSRTVVFYARVVRSSAHRVVLMTADGKTVAFSSKQISKRRNSRAHAAGDVQITVGTVSINLLGLEPGVTVVVTETVDSSGNVTITITLPSPSQTSEEQASGVVSEVDSDAFVVQTADQSDLRLHMTADALSNLNLQTCNTVDVSYHQDAGLLIADNVQITGTSATGDCTPTQDATGTITDVSDQGLSISTDQGPLTFAADSSVTDGFQVGDLVDVTYTQNADGSLNATDVEYVEEDASGTVTVVNGTTLTITDSDTGQPDTFIADPNNGVQIDAQTFAGISVGDQVDVTYHESAGQLVADTVSDNGPAGNGSNSSSGSGSGGSSGD